MRIHCSIKLAEAAAPDALLQFLFHGGLVIPPVIVGSRMPFKDNPDGTLDLYFQHDNPGREKEANWLPAPKALST